MISVRVLAALSLLTAAACSTPAPPIAPEPAPRAPAHGAPAPAPARAPAFSPGPLRVQPPFSGQVSGWAGISMFENLISSGFSRDSKLFANCHVANTKIFTKECDLLDHDHHVARQVVSNVDYGDGHSAAHDPVLGKVLGSLGVPARQGRWRYAGDLVVTWKQPNPKEIDVALRETTTRVETPLASFKRTDRMLLAPDRVVLSPDGRRVAIVVYVIGGPPLTTDAEVVDAERAASAAYARAAGAAQAAGHAQAAEILRAKSRAALSR